MDPEAGKLVELVGGYLLSLACLGFAFFVLVIWMPWMWRFHVANARWLHESGDRSIWTRGTLWIEGWRKRLLGVADRP